MESNTTIFFFKLVCFLQKSHPTTNFYKNKPVNHFFLRIKTIISNSWRRGGGCKCAFLSHRFSNSLGEEVIGLHLKQNPIPWCRGVYFIITKQSQTYIHF